MLNLLESLEANLTFERQLSPEEISIIENQATKYLGGTSGSYVELEQKQNQEREYVMRIFRR
jgi:hypothetical protein